jgi:hypothetical protein
MLFLNMVYLTVAFAFKSHQIHGNEGFDGDRLINVFSSGKSLTSIAIAKLVQDGKQRGLTTPSTHAPMAPSQYTETSGLKIKFFIAGILLLMGPYNEVSAYSC